jgi:hypothetical protein
LSAAAILRWLCLPVVALALAACASTPRIPFTVEEQAIAEVPGFPNVRIWGDGTFAEAERKNLGPRPAKGKSLQILAISGGGSAGAFGAGVLAGWTALGTRPQFDVVSGVSTGALTAPFAFLGPAYDKELVHLYTSGVTSNIFRMKFLPAGLLGTSLFEVGAFRQLVEQYATEDMLRAVAAEHRKGRRLIVVTTNMDAQRPVVWNMGLIAASGRPDALKLFQDVLIASASIPAILPPVLIDVTAEGKSFQELHADGATATQVFTIPEGILAAASPKLLPHIGKAELWVVVNNTLAPEFKLTPEGTLSVGGRGLATMLKAQLRSGIIASYGFTKQAGIQFRLANIDRQVPYDPADAFNTDYMRTLFKLGYDRTTAGTLWKDKPVLDLAPAEATRTAVQATRAGAN